MRNTNSEDTGKRIQMAAEDLFARKGYDGTTTREIAAAAGVSIQTLHYHFKEKQNLYNQVLIGSIAPVTRMINGHVEKMLAGDVADDNFLKSCLDRLIDELFETLHQNPNFPLLFFRQWLESNQAQRQVEWEALVPFLRRWIESIEGKVSAERRRGIDLSLSFISLGLVYWGLFSNPAFLGKFLGMEPRSPEYLERLKAHTKEVTSRILGGKN